MARGINDDIAPQPIAPTPLTPGLARRGSVSAVSVWERLPGQDRVVAQLRGAIDRGRVPHAYLFSGPAGLPLYEAALALATALNCVSDAGVGCGVCDACSKIIAGIHPDVVTLVREGAAQIVPIESVRTQVIARIGLPPHEASVRVFIVEEATSMAPPAANAVAERVSRNSRRFIVVASVGYASTSLR